MSKVRARRPKYDVFLAVSYRAACINDNVGAERGYRYLLECITTSFEKLHLRVYLAPREERWGARRPSRAVGVRSDVRALNDASEFLFFLDGNESDGALVELGMALALDKSIWILKRQSEILPKYVLGLLQFQSVHARDIDDESDVMRLTQEVKQHRIDER